MMYKIFLGIVFNSILLVTYCQKPAVDLEAVEKWPNIHMPKLSSDGNFFSYLIDGQNGRARRLIVINTNTGWKTSIGGASMSFFSGDSKHFICKAKDTLIILDLTNEKRRTVTKVKLFKYPNASSQWAAYLLDDQERSLVLMDLNTMKELRMASVSDFSFNNSGTALLVKSSDSSNPSLDVLRFIDLNSGKSDIIWKDILGGATKRKVSSFVFDENGDQVAFSVNEIKADYARTSIWYYRKGMRNSTSVLPSADVVDSDWVINDKLIRFSKNGDWIFLKVHRLPIKIETTGKGAQVDIWKYNDLLLQPAQVLNSEKKVPREGDAVVSVHGGRILRLTEGNQNLETQPDQVTGDFVVVGDGYVDPWWKFDPQPSFYLMSLETGAKLALKEGENSLSNFSFSPRCRYLLYYDKNNRQYWSYRLKDHRSYCVTKDVLYKVINDNVSIYGNLAPAMPVAGWQERDSSLLIYDNYDIWKIDPEARRIPENITNFFGRRRHIKLRLAIEDGINPNGIVYNSVGNLLLTGFGTENKYNGFFLTSSSRLRDPRLLTYGPYTYYHDISQLPFANNEFHTGLRPLKAQNSECWIVERENASEAPNYFITKDFKQFKQLTDFEPQAKYNWLTSELVTWREPDGVLGQGVLYKPEDFDNSKKYPIIFNYYEQLSHRVYEFPPLEYTAGEINIPWFVSHGYLVFTPDIHYEYANKEKNGKVVGEYAYNAVVSAARYLATQPYIDKRKMGIQGHSFGGLETSYLVTHSSIFAAAAEASGSTDPISAYLTLIPFPDGRAIESVSKQTGIQYAHELYGATPWERPDLYSRNSAVLSADKVTTPLLIMHNKHDNQVQWRQGVELFMALRRLSKKVWMLQYDNDQHALTGQDAVDYTIRLTEFFDYYLKDQKPPKWMIDGIPPEMKGFENNYELDSSGRVP